MEKRGMGYRTHTPTFKPSGSFVFCKKNRVGPFFRIDRFYHYGKIHSSHPNRTQALKTPQCSEIHHTQCDLNPFFLTPPSLSGILNPRLLLICGGAASVGTQTEKFVILVFQFREKKPLRLRSSTKLSRHSTAMMACVLHARGQDSVRNSWSCICTPPPSC